MSTSNEHMEGPMLAGQFPHLLIWLRKCLTAAQSRLPNLTTLQQTGVPQNPLLRLTGTSPCSHGLDHNCTCAQWQRPEPFVVPVLPGKAQARCPTRLSGTAAHWSASLLGLNILRKPWVSQGYKRTCTRHSGLVQIARFSRAPVQEHTFFSSC